MPKANIIVVSLLPSGAVSQKIVDAAKSQLDQATANKLAAQEALKLKQAGFRKEDIVSGQGRVIVRRGSKGEIRNRIRRYKITRPK